MRYAVVPARSLNWTIPRMLPKRMIDGLLARRIGLAARS